MELEEIKQVIKLMSENDLTEFQIESEGFSMSLKRGGTQVQPTAVPVPVQTVIPQTIATPQVMAPVVAAAPAAPAPAATPVEQPEKEKVETINAPLVGTFYLSSSPEKEPLVSVGSTVTPDTVVCIVEAMKVMNEVKAEKTGVIKEILVENASPVEFGQPLFVIE